ncbi:MAG: GWxTD domain-containing protein [Rhodothermales bacterium]
MSLFLISAEDVYAQQESTSFSVDVISVQGDDADDLSRLDVFTAIPHANLRFLKTGEAFTARYEVTASVFEVDDDNRKRQMIENSVWQDNVSVLQFTATQSLKQVSHSSYSLALAPGKYFLEIKLQDLASEETYRKDLLAEVRDFANPMSLSDLILVNDFDVTSHTISPMVKDRVYVNNPSFSVFYELYADSPQAVNIKRQVIRTPNSRGLPILRWLFRRWQADDSQGEISFANNEALNLKSGRNPVVLTIPVEGYEAGEYLIRVIAEDAEGNQLDVAERAITVDWADEAEYQGRDIDMAIAQLRYIAKPKELRTLRGAESKQERRERFIEFWEKRDPTPNTVQNERMDEYYLRIDFANRHYTGNNSGWETDRGHTLVLYGEPDGVDRSAADLQFSQPYEVWHYRRIGRRFIFVDKNGTGNFKLMVPTWNERSAIR